MYVGYRKYGKYVTKYVPHIGSEKSARTSRKFHTFPTMQGFRTFPEEI